MPCAPGHDDLLFVKQPVVTHQVSNPRGQGAFCLVQTREGLYQTLGLLIRNVGGFYAQTQLQPQFVSALTGCLEMLHASHIRMLIRHIIIALVKTCPENHRLSARTYSGQVPLGTYALLSGLQLYDFANSGDLNGGCPSQLLPIWLTAPSGIAAAFSALYGTLSSLPISNPVFRA